MIPDYPAGSKDELFPVYSWTVRCMIPQREELQQHYEHYDLEDCMSGWVWMSSGGDTMLKSVESFDLEAAHHFAVVEGIEKSRGGCRAAEFCVDPTPRMATWHLTWFCHETHQKFDSDEEALRSFERYVDWAERYCASHSEVKTFKDGSHYVDKPICLMGAEDRWRWRGEGYDDPPPCKCEHCLEHGATRINH